MVGKGHPANGDPLQRLWRIHRNGKREGEPGPLENYYGKEYAQSTPESIDESNLDLTFEQFSTDMLEEINRGITDRTEPPRAFCPVVLVKIGDNYHLIDGTRRLRHWKMMKDDGPHETCVLAIKRRGRAKKGWRIKQMKSDGGMGGRGAVTSPQKVLPRWLVGAEPRGGKLRGNIDQPRQERGLRRAGGGEAAAATSFPLSLEAHRRRSPGADPRAAPRTSRRCL